VLLAMRSKAATSTTENFFRRASAMTSRPGRRAFFPQTAIFVFVYNLEATLSRKLPQIVKLAFDVLVGGADADIDGCFQAALLKGLSFVHRTYHREFPLVPLFPRIAHL
jgi:hypothetical protein